MATKEEEYETNRLKTLLFLEYELLKLNNRAFKKTKEDKDAIKKVMAYLESPRIHL